ncbi:MAG: laminin B domain-containing protein [Verrucomicrobiota bacterium]
MSEPSQKQKKEKRGCGCLVVLLSTCFLVVIILTWCAWSLRWFVEPVVSETFEAGDSGWLVMGDAQGESDQPTYEVEGGNPGAYMSAVDDAVGGVWYWAAPELFREAVATSWAEKGSSRAVLRFDLKQSSLENPFDAPDVILEGAGLELHFQHENPPGLDWTSFRVPLRPSAGWVRKTGGKPATKEELAAVLGELEKLWIRGEFRTGNDSGGIDNIVIR